MDALVALSSTPASVVHNERPAYRADIDGLRAVAILSVVFFHAFPGRLQGGFVGVDIFFVISGFLISSIIFRSLEKGEFSFVEFYARRVRRIFPALIVVLTACFAIGWFALLPVEYAQFGKHMAASAGFVQNFVLWREAGYFDVTSELKPLMHLWSLAIEEQFYLVYPLLVWMAWRAGLNVLAVLLVLTSLSFALNLYGIHRDAARTFYLPQTRFWELLAGALVAYSVIHGRPRWQALRPRWLDNRREALLCNLLSITGLLLVLLSLFTIHRGRIFPGAWALLPVLAASLLLLAGPAAWVNRKILGNKLMVGIGLISYPLYLWHWPLLSYTRIMESEAPTRAIRIAAVGLSFVLAWLTWLLVERPIRFRSKTLGATAALIVILAAIGYVGYDDFRREGLPSRKGVSDFLEVNKQFELQPALRASEECRQHYFAEFSGRGFCVVSSPQAPSVVLIGDSHANHLYPGLAKELGASGETVANFGDSGCPPFFNTASYLRGDADPQKCVGMINKMLGFAEKTPSVRTIVMADIGAHYVYSATKGFKKLEERSNDWVLARVGQSRPTPNEQVYESALRETLLRLGAKGKRIVLVLDNPDLGFNPKSCVGGRPLRLDNSVRTPCAIPRREFDERQGYLDIVGRVTNGVPNVRVFDAGVRFCDDQQCSAMKDGKLLYRDRSHLSVAGSEFVARSLAPVVRETLAEARREQ